MPPLVLSAFTVVCAMGRGLAATHDALRRRRSVLRRCDFEDATLDCFIGRVDGVEDESLPQPLAAYDCRNNWLAHMALRTDGFADSVAAAKERYGANRIAVILGTSTSGILQSEEAYRWRDPATGALPADFDYAHTHDLFSLARFVRRALGLTGPASMISTACSSSANSFAEAARYIEAGLCDAAVVGGADSLCRMTLYGFASLELLSPQACRPCAADRNGISIGEAAGFALLERPDRAMPADPAGAVALLGYGESSDGYHMSSPHPEGLGAAAAMRAALDKAGLSPDEIDYVNLHGTGTRNNDAMEDKAVAQIFGTATPCSSTKGWSGHALGSAGIVEAVIAALCIRHGFVPGCLGAEAIDPAFTSRVIVENAEQRVRHVVSNSFGFGGSNCALVLGEAAL